MSREIGISLDRPLGKLYASNVERCRQTVREIAYGAVMISLHTGGGRRNVFENKKKCLHFRMRCDNIPFVRYRALLGYRQTVRHWTLTPAFSRFESL